MLKAESDFQGVLHVVWAFCGAQLTAVRVEQ